MEKPMNDDFFTAAELRKLTGASRNDIHRWIYHTNWLPLPMKIGRQIIWYADQKAAILEKTKWLMDTKSAPSKRTGGQRDGLK